MSIVTCQRSEPFARKEQRQALRCLIRLPRCCRLIRARGEGPWLAVARNISITGIGLICKHFFKPRMLLTIEIPRTDGSYRPPKLVCVKHVTPLAGTDLWSVGGVFASDLSDEELRALLHGDGV
jgi:hypothetical protein